PRQPTPSVLRVRHRRQPPPPPRFPYTTLFRSVLTIDHVLPVALGGSDDPSNLVAACRDCNAGKSSAAPDAETVAEVEVDSARWVDRKSTRLNSSHVKISYAVFCLKKETKRDAC